MAKGGRGGLVIEVTNLNDSGEGSLRSCAEGLGPRTCVFQVSGIVDLIDKITVENPYLTIAGQTAPGSGITIRGMLSLRSHDIIIRHIRVRPGPRLIPDPSNTDAVQIVDSAHDIILDHVSMSWATDEILSARGDSVHDITIQWSVISESLHCPDEPFRHEEGCHGKGLLIGVGGSAISIHHNLIAHHDDRTPLLTSGDIQFVNNVIYNQNDNTVITAKDGLLRVNVVGNHYTRGPNTKNKPPIKFNDGEEFSIGSGVFLQGNIDQLFRPDNSFPEGNAISRKGDYPQLAITTNPFNYLSITTTDAFQAKNDVLADSGANKRLNPDGSTTFTRDLVDTRLMKGVLNGSGSIINMPADVGGYPVVPVIMRPADYDTDKDGMPNLWEGLYGFDSDDPSDGILDADGDGYTNFEEFLNETHPKDSDGNLPSITITTPLEGDVLSGLVAISAESDPPQGIDHVDVYANGELIGSSFSAPYSVLWDTTTLPDGPAAISAIARDVNSQAVRSSIHITLDNVNDLPIPLAGPDQTLSDGNGDGKELVTLNGSVSFDTDGEITAYEWRWENLILGNSATLAVPNVPIGNYLVTLTVTDNRGATASDTVEIHVLPNQAPVADAGPATTQNDSDNSGGELVMLDGAASFDPDGSITSYQWQEGQSLIGTGPLLSVPLNVGTHLVTLTVTDNAGATATDTVVISINTNQSPVAAAGQDQTVFDEDNNGKEGVTLNGTQSIDHDGQIMKYEWRWNNLILGNSPILQVPAPIGNYTVTLTVTDNGGATASDTVEISVLPNVAPVARAGPDQTVHDADSSGDQAVSLNGSSSSDFDGKIIKYEWKEGSTVLGSTVKLTTTLGVGVHLLTLTVTDDGGSTNTDDLVVTVMSNLPPLANAGPDQTATFDVPALFNASASTDSDGTLVGYEWNFGDGTTGSGVSVDHLYPQLGTYTVVLTVTDNGGLTHSDTLAVTVTTHKAVFLDSFEVIENVLWVSDNQNKWLSSSQRTFDGLRSAEVHGSAIDATTTSIPIDLQGRNNATIEFSWLIKRFESGEYLAFDISTNGGITWLEMSRLRGAIDLDNTWHTESLTVQSIANLQIRFRATASKENEQANVDRVKVTAW